MFPTVGTDSFKMTAKDLFRSKFTNLKNYFFQGTEPKEKKALVFCNLMP